MCVNVCKVSVINILDVSAVLNGRLPDIYWNLDLTGTEIRVLKYVFDNCYRIYRTVKHYPKAKDGSPRFWRGKERMADDCGLSYPTFRNNVRHLHELGLLTSMDESETCPDNIYCIGLMSDFFNELVNDIRDTFKSGLTFKTFFKVLYEDYLLKFDDVANIIDCPLEDFSFSTIKRRVPFIDVPRKPFLNVIREAFVVEEQSEKTKSEKVVENAHKALGTSLRYVRTPRDQKIFEICEYYEYKCRQALNYTGYRALGKDFRAHKNWKFLEKIYTMCEENNWDYKILIDSQFDRVKYYDRKQMYPYLNQFFSEGALKYFHNYVKNYKESYSVTGDIKVKTDSVKSVRETIYGDILKDCKNMAGWIKTASRRRNYKDYSIQELMVLYLQEHWMGISANFIVSVSWYSSYLKQCYPSEGTPWLSELYDAVDRIQANSKMVKMSREVLGQVLNELELPEILGNEGEKQTA